MLMSKFCLQLFPNVKTFVSVPWHFVLSQFSCRTRSTAVTSNIREIRGQTTAPINSPIPSILFGGRSLRGAFMRGDFAFLRGLCFSHGARDHQDSRLFPFFARYYVTHKIESSPRLSRHESASAFCVTGMCFCAHYSIAIITYLLPVVINAT